MEFTHHFYESLEEAQERTRHPYYAMTTVSGSGVLVTEAVFYDTEEDKRIFDELQDNDVRKKFNYILELMQADYVNHFLDELYMADSSIAPTPEDPHFLKVWHEALRPKEPVPTGAPVVSKDWDYAQHEMGEILIYTAEALFDDEQRKYTTEDERKEYCIELFNEGIIRGWAAHRDMVDFREKYKHSIKYGSKVALDERNAYMFTRRGISDLL